MSTSTPLQPLELPPFSLHSLISPIFPLSPPSLPSSPTKSTFGSPPSSGSLGRLGQLVSNVAGGGAAVPLGGGKATSVRSVEASGEKVWVGGSDGRVRIYEVVSPAVAEGRRGMARDGSRSPNVGSPMSGRRTPTSPGLPRESTALDLVEEVVVTQGKKAADRIALLERLGKAVILSEGLLTFHSLPSLASLSVHSFPAMKGVTTFSLDEDELAGGGTPDVMHVCAIKRRTVHLLRVTKDGVTSIKDLPLRGGALISVFRRGHVCIADADNYSIVDLNAAIATPLLPISQSPNLDSRPLSSSSTSSTPPSPGGVDPRQRPAVACVGTNEFLIASHTAGTTLGVFVNEQGEPCRGTLEWGSNLRSLTVDPPYALALLHNNTLEVHSIHTQEIVQVIHLPISTSPSPLSLEPRSLVRSWAGLEVGHATGAHKLEPVSIALSRPAALSPEPPRTPTKRRETSSSSVEREGTEKGTRARTLLVGKNGLYALVPLTLVAQADALMEKGRVEDAVALAGQVESSEGGKPNPEVAYVYLRAAYLLLVNTLFQDAFDLFLRSACDPRLVVRMFPDLRDPLFGPDEEVTVCRGVQADVREGKTADEYIMANLNRNYSPHIKPSVESASPTMELRAMLATTARDCARGYLSKWRERRRSGGGEQGGAGDSRKVDMVVDTTLVRLLAEEGRTTDLLKVLEGPNDCVVQQVEPTLLDSGLYQVLAEIQLKRGEVSKALEIWTKIVEGKYVDERHAAGVQGIFDLLWPLKDARVVEKYGIWLLQRDLALGLKLFTDPRQTLTFDTRDLFSKIRAVDVDAADLFLESTVLQKRDTDSRLHADLVKRYIDRLGELLADPSTKVHLRDQELAYQALVGSALSSPPSFLFFLASRFAADSPHATFDRVRLKTILFLATSSNYDVTGTKQDLEEMEVKGLRGLTLERALVYGRLRLDRQALSLLLHSLQDLTSSETYCHQSGDPLIASDISSAAVRLSLPLPQTKKPSAAKKEGDEERKAGLARLLVEMCLVGRGGDAEGGSEGLKGHKEQVTAILETQAIHLHTIDVLPLLPSQWPLALLSPFLGRSLRRSLHTRHEASLLKALAVSQNLAVSERLGDLQLKLGPTVQRTGLVAGRVEEEERPELVRLVEKEKEYDAGEVDELDLR